MACSAVLTLRYPISRAGGDDVPMARVCVVCGRGMEGRRRGALCCGPACRRERDRLLAILSGQGGEAYESVAARVAAAHNRAYGARSPILNPTGSALAPGPE